MPNEGYQGITLPSETIEQIDEIIQNDKSFKSRAEVVKQAIRDFHKKEVPQ